MITATSLGPRVDRRGEAAPVREQVRKRLPARHRGQRERSPDARPGEHRAGHGGVPGVGQQRVHAGVGEDVAELGSGEPVVQRHEHRPDPGGREQGDQEHRIVQAEIPHAVSPADAARGQLRGQPVDPVEQFAVARGVPVECDRRQAGRGGGSPADPGTKVHRDLCGCGHRSLPPYARCGRTTRGTDVRRGAGISPPC